MATTPTLIQNGSGKLNYKTLKGLSEAGGPATGTMAKWFFGGTKRPTSAAIEAAGRAAGYKRAWVKTKR